MGFAWGAHAAEMGCYSLKLAVHGVRVLDHMRCAVNAVLHTELEEEKRSITWFIYQG